MDVKDYLVLNIDMEIDLAKRTIRQIKKDIKILEQLRTETSKKPESELMEMLVKDEDLKKHYEYLKEELKSKEKKEILDMVKNGSLREIFYDENGKEITVEPSGSDELRSESEQPINEG